MDDLFFFYYGLFVKDVVMKQLNVVLGMFLVYVVFFIG